MTRFAVTALAVVGLLALTPAAAHAVTCANGVYRAGCAGPNGAVGVRKAPVYHPPAAVYHAPPRVYPPPAVYHAPGAVYRPPGAVHCANGVYRAGCAGPNGAAVVRKPY
jgi:hypothetical protein